MLVLARVGSLDQHVGGLDQRVRGLDQCEAPTRRSSHFGGI